MLHVIPSPEVPEAEGGMGNLETSTAIAARVMGRAVAGDSPRVTRQLDNPALVNTLWAKILEVLYNLYGAFLIRKQL